MKKKTFLAYLLISLWLMLFLTPRSVAAESRSVTISAPARAAVGEKFTVVLGFSPKAPTRNFDFTMTYDNSLVKYTGKFSNLTGSSSHVITVGTPSPGKVRPSSGASYSEEIGAMIDRAVSLQFEVIKTGSVTFQFLDASDGNSGNVIQYGASKTVTLTSQPAVTTTTTTTTTTKTTTRKTTTTTGKTTPKTTTSTMSTTESTVTTPSSTPSHPGDTDPGAVFTGRRYDSARLAIPETVPSEETIPASFEPAEISHLGTQVTAYRSETLPYTLFWLEDEQGEAQFYYFDEETSTYIPYVRTEWSSRYFTFSVLPDNELPDGFVLKTADIRNRKVPVYAPSKGGYIAYRSTQDGTSDLPDDLYLLALRMNDSEKKALYFYDRTLDSLIRADLWIVPLKQVGPEPGSSDNPGGFSTTSPPAEPVTAPGGDATLPEGAKTVTLFGFTMPLWLLIGAGVFLCALLALMIWFLVRLKKSKSFDPATILKSADDEESEGGDAADHQDVTPKETWERLGIVDIAGAPDEAGEHQAAEYGEEPADVGGAPALMPADAEQAAAGDKGENIGDAASDSQGVPQGELDGAWANLEKVVESASERRRIRDGIGGGSAADRPAAVREGSGNGLPAEAEASGEPLAAGAPGAPVKESRRIIQPGMSGDHPKRRMPAKRLRGMNRYQEADDPGDRDEL